MQKYQGQTVTTIRAARQGDTGFDSTKSPQSLIKLEDGTEKVVPQGDVTNA